MDNSTVAKISKDLLQARKDRDTLRIEVLQAVLTRITNAEAVDEAHIRFAAQDGVGSTEVARKQLSDQDIVEAIQQEIDELQQTLEALASQHDHPYTAQIRQKLALTRALLASPQQPNN